MENRQEPFIDFFFFFLLYIGRCTETHSIYARPFEWPQLRSEWFILGRLSLLDIVDASVVFDLAVSSSFAWRGGRGERVCGSHLLSATKIVPLLSSSLSNLSPAMIIRLDLVSPFVDKCSRLLEVVLGQVQTQNFWIYLIRPVPVSPPRRP